MRRKSHGSAWKAETQTFHKPYPQLQQPTISTQSPKRLSEELKGCSPHWALPVFRTGTWKMSPPKHLVLKLNGAPTHQTCGALANWGMILKGPLQTHLPHGLAQKQLVKKLPDSQAHSLFLKDWYERLGYSYGGW